MVATSVWVWANHPGDTIEKRSTPLHSTQLYSTVPHAKQPHKHLISKGTHLMNLSFGRCVPFEIRCLCGTHLMNLSFGRRVTPRHYPQGKRKPRTASSTIPIQTGWSICSFPCGPFSPQYRVVFSPSDANDTCSDTRWLLGLLILKEITTYAPAVTSLVRFCQPAKNVCSFVASINSFDDVGTEVCECQTRVRLLR